MKTRERIRTADERDLPRRERAGSVCRAHAFHARGGERGQRCACGHSGSEAPPSPALLCTLLGGGKNESERGGPTQALRVRARADVHGGGSRIACTRERLEGARTAVSRVGTSGASLCLPAPPQTEKPQQDIQSAQDKRVPAPRYY